MPRMHHLRMTEIHPSFSNISGEDNGLSQDQLASPCPGELDLDYCRRRHESTLWSLGSEEELLTVSRFREGSDKCGGSMGRLPAQIKPAGHTVRKEGTGTWLVPRHPLNHGAECNHPGTQEGASYMGCQSTAEYVMEHAFRYVFRTLFIPPLCLPVARACVGCSGRPVAPRDATAWSPRDMQLGRGQAVRIRTPEKEEPTRRIQPRSIWSVYQRRTQTECFI